MVNTPLTLYSHYIFRWLIIFNDDLQKLVNARVIRLKSWLVWGDKIIGDEKKMNFFPADIYLFKVNNRKNRKMCEICSKLIIKTPEQHDGNDVILMSLLLTLNRFHTLFWCFHSWLWTNQCQLGCYNKRSGTYCQIRSNETGKLTRKNLVVIFFTHWENTCLFLS